MLRPFYQTTSIHSAPSFFFFIPTNTSIPFFRRNPLFLSGASPAPILRAPSGCDERPCQGRLLPTRRRPRRSQRRFWRWEAGDGRSAARRRVPGATASAELPAAPCVSPRSARQELLLQHPRGTSPSSAREGGCVRKMPSLLIKITLFFITLQALLSSCLTAACRCDCFTGGCQEKRGARDFGPPGNAANLKRARASPHPVVAGTRSLTSGTQAQGMLRTRRHSGPRI